MPDPAEKLEKESLNGRRHSEYFRLDISDDPIVAETDTFQTQAERKYTSVIWWIKAILWCSISALIILIFVKWGVPFLFVKVFPYP